MGRKMVSYKINEMSCHTVVVGSGAAGYNAVVRLKEFGVEETVLVTEAVNAGTSRNTGSDKQTYYKLSLAGTDQDSVGQLARDLFAGRCVDGDNALVEAALSARCFYHLAELGVPFPHNEYGEYIGYKTDHDRGRRATSVGPYTSRIMTEKLQKRAGELGAHVMDGMLVVKILVDKGAVCGILCLDLNAGPGHESEAIFTIIWCENVVYAVGGPAGMYRDSVYPVSQFGSSGIAFEAGVKGQNLTEWQFGLASKKPRWNVSGTYMQALPRFVSTDQQGNHEREFLSEYFDTEEEMMSAVFLKGYQWPFDVSKIFGGSSIIDLIVYQEAILKNRRIFLDFTKNPECSEDTNNNINFEGLSQEAYEYLKQAGACFGTPIERLTHMNEPAVMFYREHGVDLSRDMLEVAVCVQHNNGGLAVDKNWETCVKGFFAVGEVCGSHGVTRPGGSALNAGQAGSTKAAEWIAMQYRRQKRGAEDQRIQEKSLETCSREKCRGDAAEVIHSVISSHGNRLPGEVREHAADRMSRCGGMIRNKADIMNGLAEVDRELEEFGELKRPEKSKDLAKYFRLRDMLLAQKVYLYAMGDYLECHGGSRGSALYTDAAGRQPHKMLPDLFSCCLDEGKHGGVIQEISLRDGKCSADWRDVRPVPDENYTFETEWRKFREKL